MRWSANLPALAIALLAIAGSAWAASGKLVTVYKEDGTRQCLKSVGIPVPVTAAELANAGAKGGGSIVAIGSVNGLVALGDPACSAAKAGMISLTKSRAVEYGRFNIRSNIVMARELTLENF